MFPVTVREAAMAERSGSGSLRRRTGLVLAWLGAFLFATGIMLRAYVYHQVAVLPLDAYAVTTLHATGVTFFDPAKVATRTGLRVTATSTLRGDAAAAQGDTAVYDTFLAVKAADGTPIEFVQTRLALNRHTGLLVNCCNANVAGNTHLSESGLGFKFPFFAQKTTYQVFDADVRRPVPAAYAGQTSIDGMRVYKYVQVLPTSQIGSRRVPQSIMGLPQRPVQIPVRSLEATTMTYWVDPVTGAPVKVEENTRQYLQTRNGRHTRAVFAADFKQNPADVATAVNRYRSQSSQLALVHGGLPPGSLIAGTVLMAAGIAAAWGGRRRGGRRAAAHADRTALVPVSGISASGKQTGNG
jgi:Porin PorA